LPRRLRLQEGEQHSRRWAFQIREAAPHGLELVHEDLLMVNPLTPHRVPFENKAAYYRAR
jgi:hypothetical protein